jgi:hypothetical protein
LPRQFNHLDFVAQFTTDSSSVFKFSLNEDSRLCYYEALHKFSNISYLVFKDLFSHQI